MSSARATAPEPRLPWPGKGVKHALLAGVIAAGGALLLAERERGLAALGASVTVAFFTWAGLWYVAVVPLLVLPFARGEAREWLSLAALCSSVAALVYVRWPRVLLDRGLLFARFAVASGGWLLASGILALGLDGPSPRLLLVPVGLVALAIVVSGYTRRERGAPLSVGGMASSAFRGTVTFVGCALAVSLAAALHPRAEALERGFWYPMGNRDLVLRIPPLPPAPWRPTKPPIALPEPLRGEPEDENDPAVKADTQSWCLMHHRRGGMVHAIRPRSLRWEQLRFYYREGDKAAACTMERLVRRALPERGYCTLEHVHDLAVECRDRLE